MGYSIKADDPAEEHETATRKAGEKYKIREEECLPYGRRNNHRSRGEGKVPEGRGDDKCPCGQPKCTIGLLIRD